MKSKGGITQMKALNEYFLMVVFMLLLKRQFAIFMFLIWTEKHGSEREASQTFAAVFTKCLQGTLKNP